jgi:thymidylate synthase
MSYIMEEYDKALSIILSQGWDQQERTGEGCRTYFGIQTKYDISEYVPLLTYRKIFWKSFVKEVLWYISGSDKISDLQAMGCNVWTPWINDEFTGPRGLEQGSIGYGYGPNLINFGGDLDHAYRPKRREGFNQLDHVINTLKNNPNSRQAMFMLWRPDKLNDVLLPACHFAYHFMLSPDENGEMKNLSCELFQRSADYAVGVQANLFMASVFTYLIAQQIDAKPKMLIHAGSHCHIYHNALSQAREYLERTETLPVKPSPILEINRKNSIYDYTIDDFNLIGYNTYPSIKMPIAV